MLSKNNHNLKIKQASDRQLRFSLRKFGTGIASVAIASLFFIGSSTMTVHADTSDGSTTTTVLTANSTDQSTTAADALTQSAATSDSAAQSTTADNAKDQASTATDSANTATSTNSSTAQSTEADQTIINSKQNSTQAPATDNIQHGINITANNQTTGYNGSSILNANQSDGTFDVNTVVTNNNSDSRKVEEIVLLPTFTANNSTDVNMIKPVIDADKIGSGIQFTSSTGSMPTDLEVYYAITAGDFETLDVLMQNADFSWDQVVEIQFVATLQAGQSLTATVPMKIANLEQMKKQLAALADGTADKALEQDLTARNMTFDEYFYYWDADGNFYSDDIHSLNMRLAVPATDTISAIQNINGSYHAVIKNANGRYQDAPAEIQAAMPNVSPSDVTVTNFTNGSAEDTLFTDGYFRINAVNIFNAVKNLGYTTNIAPNGHDLWQTYNYFSFGTTHPDGSATKLYVEVQPVFLLQDVTLPSGSSWNQALNLQQNPSVKFTNQSSMTVTEQKELAYSTTGGAGTYQVDTSNLPLDADGNLTTPGIYNVTYIYQINDQDTVTATAQVIVQAVKMITRTIHYVDGDDNNQAVANDVTQTLTFYGTPTDAAGTVFTWEAVNGDTFASVDSPAVANMTPDTATMASQTVNATSDNTEVTVTYHHNTTAENLEHTVQRTIHFVDENGNPVANDTVQTVTLKGTKTTDLATGVSTTVWNSGQFDSVDAPTVANMTPDTATVAAMTVDENTADSEVTVTYHADQVTPDTPDQPVTPDTPTTPDQPSTPVTPAAPSQPNAVQPAVPINTSNKTAVDTTTGQKTLPQTGNQESAGILAVFGLGLSSLALSFTGLFKKRHN
ncbi:mucin-binding protein [Limosilactobacillus mucosae]|uniref:YSIRK-type signal peptide-containing protein n=1 Tax=Limosilactobacillus mucosae TaxID=97478 RepID=A0AAJ1HMN2_LIMMU|nr:YSIRK-type signal peptide-containing protein [Limosilactobacillus mucosae]MDC2826893.1 YSIRK-type signal peptide-containing protein [Limosilactobacillus mucosae]MDC2836244.1 YSIRK-type signal peptide-containing protein [Limosilactobacillus mucosae]